MSDQDSDPQAEQGVEQRVASLEAGQESLSEKVDKILGIVSGQGGSTDDGGGHGDEPTGGTNIAHEIRAQLEERDRQAAADAAEQGKADRLAAAEAKIAELAEKPPAPMPRRVEKIMGWR